MPTQSNPENSDLEHEHLKIHEHLLTYVGEFTRPLLVLCFEELKPRVKNIFGSEVYAILAKFKASIID
jgi:hypothetical protein